MANRVLSNYADISGEYNGLPFQATRSSLVEVTLADPDFIKTADQDVWFSGQLTFLLTLDNREGLGPMTNISITDALDSTKFSFVPNSEIVRLDDGEPLVPGTDYSLTYTPGTPTATLEIDFLAGGQLETIPAGSQATISFRGDKVAE